MSDVDTIAKQIIECFKNGNKLLICGNGGSSCESSHFAGELVGKFKKERKALPAIALNDVGMITAIGNDYGYDHVFSRQVEAYGNEGDILITLSTSGKSKNVLEAIRACSHYGLEVISFPTNKEASNETMYGDPFRTGKQHPIKIDFTTADTQVLHLKMIHDICEKVEEAFI